MTKFCSQSLRKLTGIQIDNSTTTTEIKQSGFDSTISNLAGKKLVFAGQDYKGTLDIPEKPADGTAQTKKSTLELYLKGPDDYLKIEGVNVASTGHTLSEGTATIAISPSGLNILERNNEWLTTQLDVKGVTPKDSSITFGEWNNYDLPDKCHVEINFA